MLCKQLYIDTYFNAYQISIRHYLILILSLLLAYCNCTDGDGTQVIFERSQFLGNRGLSGEGPEFGAAVGISFTNFFRNRESFPKYRFTDW